VTSITIQTEQARVLIPADQSPTSLPTSLSPGAKARVPGLLSSHPQAKGSEDQAQGELHEPRRGDRSKISAELCCTEGQRGLRAAHVVAHRVGGVERFPFEFQTPLFTQVM
jgi:hypothetical protein